MQMGLLRMTTDRGFINSYLQHDGFFLASDSLKIQIKTFYKVVFGEILSSKVEPSFYLPRLLPQVLWEILLNVLVLNT